MLVAAALAFLALPIIVWARVRDTRNDDQPGACLSMVCGIVGVAVAFVALFLSEGPWLALLATGVAFVTTTAVMFLTGDAVLAALQRIKDQRIWIAPWVFAVVVWPIATPIVVAFAFVSLMG